MAEQRSGTHGGCLETRMVEPFLWLLTLLSMEKRKRKRAGHVLVFKAIKRQIGIGLDKTEILDHTLIYKYI